MNLLQIELKKVKSYPVFWIIFGIIIVLFLLFGISAANLNLKIGIFSGNSDISTDNYFKFPYVWTTFTWIAGWFSQFWALLLIILVGNEFNFRMYKQQLIYGLNKKQLIFSKIILMSLLPILILFFVFLLSIIFGLKNTEGSTFSQIFDKSFYLVSYYIQAIAFMSFAMLIVTLVGSTGLSIIMYLGYLIFEGIFRLMLTLKKVDGIIHFLPFKAIQSLTPRPSLETAMSDNLQQQLQLSDNTSQYSIFLTLLVAVVYVLIFWGLTYLIIKKKDM